MEFKSLEEKFRAFQNGLDHLCKVRQPAKICDEDPSCYETILCLKSLIEHDDMFNDDDHDDDAKRFWSLLAKKNYELLFVDILFYLSKKCQKFKTDLNERPILIFDFVLEIVYRLTEHQLKLETLLEFSVRLCEVNVCDALLSFFKRDKYLNKSWTNYDPHKRIINIMGILLNVSENPFVKWTDAQKLDIEVVLLGYASPHVKVYTEMTERILKNVNRCASLSEFLLFITSSLHGDPVRIVENEKCYNDLFFLRYKIKSNRAFDNEENLLLTSSASFLQVLIDFLCHVNKELMHEVNFDLIHIEIVKPRQTPSDLKQRIYSLFFNIMVILNELMFRSEQARVYFTRTSLIKCLSQFLTENYIKKLRSKHEKVILMLVQNLSLMSGWPSSSDQVNLSKFLRVSL